MNRTIASASALLALLAITCLAYLPGLSGGFLFDDFLRLAGVHHSLLLAEAEPLGFAVNKLNLEFLKPARIDDALIVRSMFETIKGPRIFISQEIERAGEILVRA